MRGKSLNGKASLLKDTEKKKGRKPVLGCMGGGVLLYV